MCQRLRPLRSSSKYLRRLPRPAPLGIAVVRRSAIAPSRPGARLWPRPRSRGRGIFLAVGLGVVMAATVIFFRRFYLSTALNKVERQA